MDDGDWAADVVPQARPWRDAERERQALIARARAGLPPPGSKPRGPIFDTDPKPPKPTEPRT